MLWILYGPISIQMSLKWIERKKSENLAFEALKKHRSAVVFTSVPLNLYLLMIKSKIEEKKTKSWSQRKDFVLISISERLSIAFFYIKRVHDCEYDILLTKNNVVVKHIFPRTKLSLSNPGTSELFKKISPTILLLFFIEQISDMAWPFKSLESLHGQTLVCSAFSQVDDMVGCLGDHFCNGKAIT